MQVYGPPSVLTRRSTRKSLLALKGNSAHATTSAPPNAGALVSMPPTRSTRSSRWPLATSSSTTTARRKSVTTTTIPRRPITTTTGVPPIGPSVIVYLPASAGASMPDAGLSLCVNAGNTPIVPKRPPHVMTSTTRSGRIQLSTAKRAAYCAAAYRLNTISLPAHGLPMPVWNSTMRGQSRRFATPSVPTGKSTRRTASASIIVFRMTVAAATTMMQT